MVKADMDARIRAVMLYDKGIRTEEEVAELFGVTGRTFRRWLKSYRKKGVNGLNPKSTRPKKPVNQTKKNLVERIVSLKRKYPSWGARRIKYQFNLPLHWTTVNDVLKKKGLQFKIKAKPQPCKRFMRKHVDSMWQGDTFQFRIKHVGKVYVTGYSDDCSRFRIRSKAYLRKGAKEAINALAWALKRKRVPREIYHDNGKQFVAKEFKQFARKRHIKIIFGKPYHPRGRGKIESYHKTLYRDLICKIKFKSLAHFRRELQKFDRQYNYWRKQEIHGWKTPAAIYFNKKYYNKNAKRNLKSGHMSG